MKHLLFFLALTLSVIGQIRHDSLSYKLDKYFTALSGINNFNGNVVISKNDKILLDKTYNMPDDIQELKVTRGSKFIIASVSKIFIKFAILKLAEQNKIQLSDKLNKYIPDFPDGDKILIVHLMKHQSGLPRELKDYEKYDSLSLNKVVELAKLEKIQFEPGTQTFYSNVGYFLLHYIIDKNSPKGYLNFIQKEIFNKLNLKSASEFNSSSTIKNFAYGYDNDNGKIKPTPLKNINRFETGNYVINIIDLYSFSRQMLDGKVLKKSLALKMFEGDTLLNQAGGRPGYRAYFYKNISSGITFIFTSNYTDMPIQETISDVFNILEDKPYPIPNKVNRIEINVPIELLKKYSGKFELELDPTQKFTIELIDKGLVVVDNDGNKIAIHPDSETTFFDNPTSKDGYIFSLNQKNEYDLTIISTGLKLKTKRIQ